MNVTGYVLDPQCTCCFLKYENCIACTQTEFFTVKVQRHYATCYHLLVFPPPIQPPLSPPPIFSHLLPPPEGGDPGDYQAGFPCLDPGWLVGTPSTLLPLPNEAGSTSLTTSLSSSVLPLLPPSCLLVSHLCFFSVL